MPQSQSLPRPFAFSSPSPAPVTLPAEWRAGPPFGQPTGRRVLVNAKLMPTPGLVYRPVRVEWSHFLAQLRLGFVSFIGYEQTATYLSRRSGLIVPLNRADVVVADGDVLLICHLPYRLPDPAKKGQEVREDFEFWVCPVGAK